jgi:hypothetical protein
MFLGNVATQEMPIPENIILNNHRHQNIKSQFTAKQFISKSGFVLIIMRQGCT